ncbi:MAG: PilX N-terminal domain-containing pilus assembly protein [Pyrinomonadaceae bacterium]
MKIRATKYINTVHTKENGAALAIVVIILAVLTVVSLSALAFSSSEAQIAGNDLQRTQTFYAASASLEKMTSDFSDIFRKKITPSAADLATIAAAHPTQLEGEGFSFDQSIEEDSAQLTELQALQGLPADVYPRVVIPSGPYAGLYASIIPYKLTTVARQDWSKAEVMLDRNFNNYLVPLFQFGIFSNDDITVSPGPLFTFNGRVHTNRNLYALRNTKFLNKVTIGGEFVRNVFPSGEANVSSGRENVWVEVNGYNVKSELGKGSVVPGGGTEGGPFILGSASGDRGYYPGSPTGVASATWDSVSVMPANGAPNRFGGQLLTNSTGAAELKLPLELSGHSPIELIKRSLPFDSTLISDSRYENKAEIRVIIDDEGAGNGAANAAGIPSGKGVDLSTFVPEKLDGGNALRRLSDSGAYLDSATIKQQVGGVFTDAVTVRSAKAGSESSPDYIPGGAGLSGHILVEIVKPDGTTLDVTKEILSMGMTVGEPNGIFYLQRPLWAAYVQGSRDRSGNSCDLVNLTRNYQSVADGEIVTTPSQDPLGFINASPSDIDEDSTANGGTGTIVRSATSPGGLNTIVPIDIYDVREGWYRSQMDEYNIYERGIIGVIDINMRNLARWLDGIYDTNLLASTNAVSTNINSEEGFVVYVSDRRGDKKKIEYNSDGTNYLSTNGNVDNEDIYGPNGVLDPGEDAIDFGWEGGGSPKKGTLQKDTSELPDVGTTFQLSTYSGDRFLRSQAVLQTTNSYFRRAIRLFDGETLSFSAAPGKLSPTQGITIATENPAYIWGNFNTTGISSIPVGGSTTNNGGYLGPQVPSSIVADAFSPLSKTWFDGLSAMYPEGSSDGRNMTGQGYRVADANLAAVSESTSVRAGIIAGTTISGLNGTPGRNASGSRLNGGIINYPRFLELWNWDGSIRSWNYSGSFIPLYRSTQAIAQWENDTSIIYLPPQRNWSFDTTFLAPNKIPPGTPFFQYVQSTAFRQEMR